MIYLSLYKEEARLVHLCLGAALPNLSQADRAIVLSIQRILAEEIKNKEKENE